VRHEDPERLTEHVIASPPSPADRDAYRSLVAAAAKTVALLSTTSGGWDHVVPVTDFLSVSYDPPTMLVSVYGLSRIAEAIDESGGWALSILTSEQRAVAERFHDPGGPLVGLLDNTPHHRRAAGEPVVIAGCLAWFRLRTVAAHDAATHRLYVGGVVAMGRAGAIAQRPLLREHGVYRD